MLVLSELLADSGSAGDGVGDDQEVGRDVGECGVWVGDPCCIYGPTRQAPAWRDVEAPEAPTGEPIADIVLTPGDVLYLPRGWWHAVTADQGTASLHLTFGLATQTGAEFLGWAVDELRVNATVRQDVPRHSNQGERAAYLEAVRKDVLTLLDEPDVLDRWAPRSTGPTPDAPACPCPTWAPCPPSPGPRSSSPPPAPTSTRTTRW